MEFPNNSTINPPVVTISDQENNNKELQETSIEVTLPKHTKIPGLELRFYENYWHPTQALPKIIRVKQHFQAHDTDIIIASKPKCGTTWLKSLVYATMHRTHFNSNNHPLLTKNPHELIPFLVHIYSKENPDLSHIPHPRLFAVHDPYELLSPSMKDSKCKIVYIARNPFDTLVSLWHFGTSIEPDVTKKVPIDVFFDCFYKGMDPGGPHWDHVLGYWKSSLETPDKVLFLKYEDLKGNGIAELKKLAKFLGRGFSLEEEEQGVVEDILKLCSLNKLKELEVNKSGKQVDAENKDYFRKGEVGDWVHYLSPSMFERLEQVMKDKFAGSGLEFQIRCSN